MMLDSNTTMWLWLGFVGMSLGTLVILSLWNKFKPEHRWHVILALMVTTIAGAAYYSMATGQGVALFGDKTIFFARYIDWILTTPLLLLSLILVALPVVNDPERKRERNGLIGAILFSDIAMIVTGAVANFSITTQDKTVWYIASLGWFLIVIWFLYGQVRRQAQQSDKNTAKTYTKLLLFLSILWVCYPIVWLLGNSGYAVISTASEAAIYAVLDVTAKAIFGTVLLASLLDKKGLKRRS